MYERGELYYKAKTQSLITWNNQWVLDIKQTVTSCRIFMWYHIYLINDNGIGSVQTLQAGSMSTNGVSNDLFNNFNSIFIIVFISVLDHIIYQTLRKHNINFKPVWRFTFGFCLAALAQVVGAVVQCKIHQTSPCRDKATNCPQPAPIAWMEVSLFILQAASECFAMTSGYELAYRRSPPH